MRLLWNSTQLWIPMIFNDCGDLFISTKVNTFLTDDKLTESILGSVKLADH